MHITFQRSKDRAFYIDLGFKCGIFRQIHLISWGWEYYSKNGDIEYATYKGIFKHPKYK